MPDAYGYQSSPDYAPAYGALQRRITASFSGQRANLNNELASRGVGTSGVSAIPSSALDSAQAGQEAGAAGHFAEAQANTAIEDRRRAEEFDRQKQLMQYGSDIQNAMQRRLAQSQLQGQLIGGGIGAVGSYLSRPGSSAPPQSGSYSGYSPSQQY